MAVRETSFGGRPTRRLLSFTLREQILLAMLGSSVVLAKWAVRMPLHVPGRSGVFWIPFFVIGRGVVRRPGAGLLMGLIAGMLAMIALPSDEGMLGWVKYAAAGLMMDAAAFLFAERLDNAVLGVLAGALAHLAKLISMLGVVIVMGIPAASAAVGLGVSATTHAIFGALGGLIGSAALWRLARFKLGFVPETSIDRSRAE